MGASFTSGNVVVSLSQPNMEAAGDPSIAPLALAEFTPSGLATGNVIALPAADTSTATGTNFAIVGSQSPTTLYGSVKRSTDGRFLALSAANVPATTGTSLLPGGVFASGSFQNRTIAVIDADGAVNTTTRFVARGTTPRGVVSTNGTSLWWAADTGSGDAGGVRYLTTGGTVVGPLLTGVGVSTASRSTTSGIGTYADQLYVAYNTGTFRGVYTLGSGMPQSGGPLVAGLVVGGTSVTDFRFADANTLYVAVSSTDASLAGLGLQKWVSQSGSWSNVWTGNPAGALGVRSLEVSVSGTSIDIYGVTLAGTSTATPNALVKLSDTLNGAVFPAGGFTTLATSTGGSLFRGVALAPVPEPTALALSLAGGAAIAALVRRRGRNSPTA
ncbi:MAG: PEP-CTERM sorting domain-containing protein [Planctomycetes bacterium]|nr:PEP-CTERM sorting domain-containing protein [Planctomycetota bacterium]